MEALDMTKEEAGRTMRVQMALPPASMARLDSLVKRTESSSYAEVMRNALRLYDAAVEQTEKGGGMFFLEDGEYRPVLAPVGK